ncbi:MAG: dUTP diphosphatase [Clostridia bacterium]|nr:dUTP diphosphatase [Clostridia bacterium]
MEKIRGFEIAKGFENMNINLPERKTKYSAGYDVEAAEDCVVPAYKFGQKPTLIKTGIKAYMPENEYLMLTNRSSNPGKRGLVMANGIGIIDSDYYGNPDNDGAFMYSFFNFFEKDLEIKKGDIIGQAIFQKYYIADDDNAEGERVGGFGSTDKK